MGWVEAAACQSPTLGIWDHTALVMMFGHVWPLVLLVTEGLGGVYTVQSTAVILWVLFIQVRNLISVGTLTLLWLDDMVKSQGGGARCSPCLKTLSAHRAACTTE